MPKTQKTTKVVKAKAVKKPAKKSTCKKACKCEPETHSLKNLTILWVCLFAMALLGVVGYAFALYH